MHQAEEKLFRCLESVKKRTDFKPETALVLGSGLGDYADGIQIVDTVDYKDIEGFPTSTVEGHKGRFVFGYVGKVPVVIMQGRVHYYEGYPMTDVVLPIRLMGEVYSVRMRNVVKDAAKKLGISLKEGVYMQFSGPNYETPAEIRMCRVWGADAAGMSTACEAMAARHMGLEVCGISCITNQAAGMGKKLDHKEVQETADKVSREFSELVTEVIAGV